MKHHLTRTLLLAALCLFVCTACSQVPRELIDQVNQAQDAARALKNATFEAITTVTGAEDRSVTGAFQRNEQGLLDTYMVTTVDEDEAMYLNGHRYSKTSGMRQWIDGGEWPNVQNFVFSYPGERLMVIDLEPNMVSELTTEQKGDNLVYRAVISEKTLTAYRDSLTAEKQAAVDAYIRDFEVAEQADLDKLQEQIDHRKNTTYDSCTITFTVLDGLCIGYYMDLSVTYPDGRDTVQTTMDCQLLTWNEPTSPLPDPTA